MPAGEAVCVDKHPYETNYDFFMCDLMASKVLVFCVVLLRRSAALRSGNILQETLRPALDVILASPLNKLVLVPMARDMMKKTAEANSVPWERAAQWIEAQGPWELTDQGLDFDDYYKKQFHAYDYGNLEWQAAFEQEIASKAVGARNYPDFGKDGETAFRGAFEAAFNLLGVEVPVEGHILDMGCGVGTSSRRLCEQFPQAESILGIDLSPYFISVGNRLLDLEPTDSEWVSSITKDPRLSLQVGDATHLSFLPDCSFDLIQCSLVVHELPPSVTFLLLQEAARLLKPGGQLCISEMDFDTTGFANLRANPLLFSMIRSTEPFLDEWADYNARGLIDDLLKLSAFSDIALRAATGRHFALLATKHTESSPTNQQEPRVSDLRAQTAMPDTHLATWSVAS